MKKLILIILIVLPFTAKQHQKTNLSMDFYAKWNQGDKTITVSKIWFNIDKERRREIIDSIYNENYNL